MTIRSKFALSSIVCLGLLVTVPLVYLSLFKSRCTVILDSMHLDADRNMQVAVSYTTAPGNDVYLDEVVASDDSPQSAPDRVIQVASTPLSLNLSDSHTGRWRTTLNNVVPDSVKISMKEGAKSTFMKSEAVQLCELRTFKDSNETTQNIVRVYLRVARAR